jgi:hypothetical protein
MPDEQDPPQKIIDLPYQQRRLIVVGDVPHVQGPKLGLAAPYYARHVLRAGRGHPGTLLVTALAAAGVYAGVKVWEAIDVNRKRDAGVRFISAEDAAGLRFQDGHPRTNMVYAAHPRVVGIYVPVADLDLYLMMDRLTEYVGLFIDLGAEEVDVQVQDQKTLDIVRAGMDLPLTTTAAGVPVSAGQVKVQGSGGLHTLRGGRYYWRGVPRRSPHFDLAKSLWYAEDPFLRKAVDDLLGGVQTIETAFTSFEESSWSVGGTLSANLVKSGFELGGDLKRARDMQLQVHVRLPDPRATSPRNA